MLPPVLTTFSRGWPLLALVLVFLGVPIAWRLWIASSSSPPAKPLPVHDDLLHPADDVDAVAREESPHDVLVVGEAELYLARGDARTIRSFPKDGGAGRDIAKLDHAAAGMVLAAGSLWLAAGQDVQRIALPEGRALVVTKGLHRAGAIASDGAWVFVVDEDTAEAGLLPQSSVLRLAPDGGAALVLGRSEGEIDTLALGGDLLFWCNRLDGTILAVPKAGGAARVLASERGLPEKLAVHEGALYWVERRSESLWTMPASGGPPRQITQDFAGFANLLVVDGRGVFWSNEAAVEGAFRVLRARGSKPGEELAASDVVHEIDALATDSVNLYWDREGNVERVAPPAD